MQLDLSNIILFEHDNSSFFKYFIIEEFLKHSPLGEMVGRFNVVDS